MWDVVRTVLRSVLSALKTHRYLALENVALRHQLAVYRRQSKKPRLEDLDRLVWIVLCRLWPSWQSVLTFVRPATVVGWHRKGFRAYWRRRSRSPGRPRIDRDLRKLIRDMWSANPTWGRERIQSELAKLGITLSDSTVRRYRPHRRKPPSQSWRSFLANHAKQIVAIDFFTVPTVTFRVLYVLVMMSHDRRKVVHFNVTDSPSAQWTGQQIVEAFPWDTAPRYLLRDRDGVSGEHFVRRVKSMGIDEVLTAPRSPWQNPYCERLVGSIRREFLDHMIVFNEQHLRLVLNEYFSYYHGSRTHQSLENDCPEPRPVEPPEMGEVIALPMVGGLHHRYGRVPTLLAA